MSNCHKCSSKNVQFPSEEKFLFYAHSYFHLQAITAALVGGILFFIVAIILSVCTVKICNNRKRRKQEKGTGCMLLLYGRTHTHAELIPFCGTF